MSVSVRHDSSFREEIGFIILHYKFSESFGNGKSFLYEYLVLSLKFNEYTHVDAHETLRFALSDKGGRLEVFQDGTKKITEIAIYCEYYLCNFLIDFIPQD